MNLKKDGKIPWCLQYNIPSRWINLIIVHTKQVQYTKPHTVPFEILLFDWIPRIRYRIFISVKSSTLTERLILQRKTGIFLLYNWMNWIQKTSYAFYQGISAFKNIRLFQEFDQNPTKEWKILLQRFCLGYFNEEWTSKRCTVLTIAID